jgi:hypothetical protein
MECSSSLVLSQLLLPDLDPDDVRQGQLLVFVTALSLLLLTQLMLRSI